MRTIYKVVAPIADRIELLLPKGVRVLSVCCKLKKEISFWFFGEMEAEKVLSVFRVYATGCPNHSNFEDFIGTVQDGEFVWHVFRVP